MNADRHITLTATVGLPGVGKTTWARDQRREALEEGRILAVVERDAFRDMLGYRWDATPELRSAWEYAVTEAQHAAIFSLLLSLSDVVVSDTNMRPGDLDRLRNLADLADARFEVRDFTDIPVEECIRRDALRPPYEPGGPCSGRSVGEKVIRAMWEKYTATRTGVMP